MHKTLLSPDVYVCEIRILTTRKINRLRLFGNGGGGGGVRKIIKLEREEYKI
jgi:hypothetical protein